MSFLINKLRRQNRALSAGFSLVETLTTLVIFSIVFMVVSAAFLSSLSLQRRAFNLQSIEENMNFVLESMAKEIRVSDVRSRNTNCPSSPATALTLDHPVQGTIIYSISGNAIQKRVGGGAANPITSNTIQVTRLQFCVSGSDTEDRMQPRITILASVRSTKVAQQTTIDVQTTLSQRLLSN